MRPHYASLLTLLVSASLVAACGDDSAGTPSDIDAGDGSSTADGSADIESDTTDPVDTDTNPDPPDTDGSTEPDADGSGDSDADDGGDADTNDPDTADGFAGTCTEAPEGYAASIPEPDLYTPRWAFLPWISKDISNREDTYEFVDGFIERDIPVGVVVLDSPWDSNYTTFIPNPDRYGDFPSLVSDMQDRGVRIILWTTQFVNETSFDLEIGGDLYDNPSPNFPEASACDFCVNNNDTYFWWKGYGCGLDFFNEDALYWWNEQTRTVIEQGAAGWKLDFGDSYVRTDTVLTATGEIPHQEYSEEYYRAMLAYGQNLVGRENFITMVRPYDDSYDFDGRFFARPEHAPVAWVGDNRRDWVGFIDAMDHTFRSVEAGYRVVGSDLGGYLDRDDTNLTITVPENENAFQTWTAVSALSPFMQLHGRANLTPWTFGARPEFTVSNYRYWAKLHTELIPVMYSLANLPGDSVTPLIDPVGADLDAWQNDWSYLFAGVFHVAPPLDDTLTRDVTLPADVEWFDWWNLAEFEGIAGGTTFEDVQLPLGRVPLHIRAGALLPLHVSDNVTGLGLATDESRTTLLYIGGDDGEFTELADDGTTTFWNAAFARDEVNISWSRAVQPVTLHARFRSAPGTVTIYDTRLEAVDSLAALEALDPLQAGWFHDEANHLFLARIPASADAGSIRIEFSR